MAFPTGWTRRVEITEAATSPSLTGYVALVTESNLPAEIWTRAQNGGGDLRVALNSDGTNQLPLEVVSFDTVGQTAQLWVRFPTFAALDSFWLFYDTASTESQPAVNAPFGRNEVWQDWATVHHGNSGVNSTGDSNFDLSCNGTPTYDNSPPTGVGFNTASGNNWSALNQLAPIEGGVKRYVHAWLYKTAGGEQVFNTSGGTTDKGAGSRFALSVDGSGNVQLRVNSGRVFGSGSAFSLNSWQMVGFNLKDSSLSVSSDTYVNVTKYAASTTGTTINTLSNSGIPYSIGREVVSSGSVSPWSGSAAEIWIANNESGFVDDAYVFSLYANQSSPATFWSTGTPEDTGGSTPTITVEESLAPVNLQSFNPAITLTGEITVSESLASLNLQNLNPITTVTEKLTESTQAINLATPNPLVVTSVSVVESTQPATLTSLNPTVTVSSPNEITIVEQVNQIALTPQNPTIQTFGTIVVEESLASIELLRLNPFITVGVRDAVVNFTGIIKSQSFAGILDKQKFNGTIKQRPNFSGTFKRQSFKGARK